MSRLTLSDLLACLELAPREVDRFAAPNLPIDYHRVFGGQLLAQAIVREGYKADAAGMNPMDLKRGLDTAVAAVVDELMKRSKKVTTNAEIAQVGTISANDDRAVGEILIEMHSTSGRLAACR